jgi:hypothetical protein
MQIDANMGMPRDIELKGLPPDIEKALRQLEQRVRPWGDIRLQVWGTGSRKP